VSSIEKHRARIVTAAIKPLSSFPTTIPQGGISRVVNALREVLSNVPVGMYCYDDNGHCPYWSADQTRHEYEYGHCSLVSHDDWNSQYTSLLHEQCKECSLKLDHDNSNPLGPIIDS